MHHTCGSPAPVVFHNVAGLTPLGVCVSCTVRKVSVCTNKRDIGKCPSPQLQWWHVLVCDSPVMSFRTQLGLTSPGLPPDPKVAHPTACQGLLAWQQKVSWGSTFFAQNLGVIKRSPCFQLGREKTAEAAKHHLSTSRQAKFLRKLSCGESL